MADFSAEVIRYLRRKSDNGFDEPITYLGAEQRFVGALRNSGVNNLEEQYIVGTDTYTEIYTDSDGNRVEEKEFHINSSSSATSNYYKLVSVFYEDGVLNEDFFFDGTELKLPDDANEVLFGDGSAELPDASMIYCVSDTTFVEENGELRIYPSSFTTLQKDELYFIKDKSQPNTNVHVLTKITGRKYLDDGARQVIKESIINHLQP